MSDEIAEAKVAPRALYYVVIDGTEAKDSAAFGGMIQGKFGWRNLLGEFLPTVEDQPTGLPGDKDRLIDEAHPYLPVHLHKTNYSNKKIAVVEPGGRDCIGKDPHWKEYAGEQPSERPNGVREWKNSLGDSFTTYGRHTAQEKSARFLKRFILEPAVEVTPGSSPVKARVHDSHPDLVFPWPEHLIHADLLLVSSHGWLGGFMKGNRAQDWPDAKPKEAQPGSQAMSSYFAVGEASAKGWKFRGPLWIILAQCSTANSATWEFWVDLFGRSSPIVRGLLAYEEASPAASGSITIADNFFKKLAQGKTMLEAWKLANNGQNWAAVVHKEALNDTMQDWRTFTPITDGSTTDSTSAYRGFLRSIPDGEEIFKKTPPLGVMIKRLLTEDTWIEITPELLDTSIAGLWGNRYYGIGIVAPSGEKLAEATIEWVHIRPTYSKQFGILELFARFNVFEGDDELGLAVDGSNKRRIVVALANGARDMLKFCFLSQTPEKLRATGLEAHHSYLWIRATATTESGVTLKHDFKTTGVSYYGV
ncbi:MAG: hypothetical protein H6811_04195 [Phycisphaeraceae bacterium]|nr:hypothetical protein [Phycisphaeraceae bacterium]